MTYFDWLWFQSPHFFLKTKLWPGFGMICRDYQLARVRFDSSNSPVDSLHCWSVRWSIASDFLRPWPEKAELERWLMNTVKVGRPKMGHWWDRCGTGGFGLILGARILILEHCFYGKCFSWVSQIRRIGMWGFRDAWFLSRHNWAFLDLFLVALRMNPAYGGYMQSDKDVMLQGCFVEGKTKVS